MQQLINILIYTIMTITEITHSVNESVITVTTFKEFTANFKAGTNILSANNHLCKVIKKVRKKSDTKYVALIDGDEKKPLTSHQLANLCGLYPIEDEDEDKKNSDKCTAVKQPKKPRIAANKPINGVRIYNELELHVKAVNELNRINSLKNELDNLAASYCIDVNSDYCTMLTGIKARLTDGNEYNIQEIARRRELKERKEKHLQMLQDELKAVQDRNSKIMQSGQFLSQEQQKEQFELFNKVKAYENRLFLFEM